MKYIEKDFPIEKLNEIARKESVVSLKKPVYLLHRWWARRLGSVFRMILLTSFIEWEELEKDARKLLGISLESSTDREMDDLIQEKMEEVLWERFYSKNDFGGKIVLDPFMGGGTTVVEALRLGMKPIGIDINPVAWFVTKKEVEPLDLDAFEDEFGKLEIGVGEKIKGYYKTHCPICEREKNERRDRGYKWTENENELVDVMYLFWVNKIRCLNPICKKNVHLFPSFKIATKKNKKEGTTHTIFCPKCRHIFETKRDDIETKCSECGFEFIPSNGYVSKGTYSCPHCGQRYKVLDSVRKSRHISEREMYAVEYYCPIHGRGYKKADEFDLSLFEKAKKELEEQWDGLIGKYIPEQEIIDGEKTKDLLNYQYKYFYEMFNERQLLCMSMLLREILKIEDDNIKEYFLATFSTILEYNNMFCRYIQTMRYVENLFSLHAYYPKNDPLENNLWGTKVGKGTFKGYTDKTIRSKKYCLEPYEYKISKEKGRAIDKIYINDKIIGNLAFTLESISNGKNNVLLLSQTAEDLSFIDDQSIDAIITDPPYYDNVMYSELADFFYIWLRLALKDKYPWFRAKYTRNKREIIKNDIQGKDEEFFLKGIQRVFTVSNRVLKDDGLMAFTFHHKETEAWASMLSPILNAGFYVNAVYPIHSEMGTSTHIINKKSISYDTIIVCRKRINEPSEVSWNNLKIQIYGETKKMIERLLKTRPHLGEGDVKIIAMGKGLELYSKRYPNVLFKDGYLEPRDATFSMDGLVDQIIEEVKESELPSGLDEVSKIYVAHLLGVRSIDYDSINKLIRTKNFDIRLLENERLIEKTKGNQFTVLGPMRRAALVEDKIKSNEDLLYIDKIHYLIHHYRRGKPISLNLSKWKDETISMTLKLYYAKNRDEDVKKIMDMLDKTTEIQRAPTLDRFDKEMEL